MRREKRSLRLLGISVIICFLGIISMVAAAEAQQKKVQIWSSYDVGSAGYTQASAIATGLLQKYGIKVRLIPSGTAIGRLTPITTNRCDAGFLANEVFFAVEGLYDFATYEWGPQDLRVVLAPPSSIGLATQKTSGIIKISDLRGKRVAAVPGNPAINAKTEGWLAFGGLTWADVKRVEYPTYLAYLEALKEGTVDAGQTVPPNPICYDLESSPRGLRWIEFPADDKAGWDRMTKVLPFVSPALISEGAGCSKEKPVWLASYRYPIITVNANASEEEIYNLTKMIDETFDLYKNAHASMPEWELKKSGVTPVDAPFHEGAIKYLKEKGVWTTKDDDWNKARLSHMKRLQEAWNKALEEGVSKKMKANDFSKYWLEERAKALNK